MENAISEKINDALAKLDLEVDKLNMFDCLDGGESRQLTYSAPEPFAGALEVLRRAAVSLTKGQIDSIELRPYQLGFDAYPEDKAMLGITMFDRKSIFVFTDRATSKGAQFRVLAHELAHAIGGIIRQEDGANRTTWDKAGGEIYAEAVAFVVSHSIGLDTSYISAPYAKCWAMGSFMRPSKQDVIEASEKIIQAMIGVRDER